MTDGSDSPLTPPAPTTASLDTPYAGLTPDLVLDALAGVGLRGDGRLIQLNSYENRVFQVFLEDGRVVVTKFYRPARWSDEQILEEHDFTAELEAHELLVAAPWRLEVDVDGPQGIDCDLVGATLAHVRNAGGGFRFSVTARLTGRAPELEDPVALEWLGRFIGRLHAVGARRPFEHRQTLDIATFGHTNRDWLLEHDMIAPDAAPAWREAVGIALDAVQSAFDRGPAPRSLRLHGDCHLGNVLWSADGPRLVDFDDAVNGPAVQDLWMLLSGDRASMTQQLSAVLDGYEAFMDFDRRELRLIEALRTLRQLHHSAWIAKRWRDPAFPAAFPWFASPAYWAEQTTRLREQIEAMAEPPLGGLG